MGRKTKTCTQCEKDKSLDNFFRNANMKDGHLYICKDCARKPSSAPVDYSNEVWLPIKGFEGEYEVSNKGRVRSVDRVIDFISKWGTPAKRRYKGKTRVVVYNVHGYASVNLKGKSYTVHSLVMETFSKKPFQDAQVNHKDGDKKNNDISNLEWCSASQNSEHRNGCLGHRPPNMGPVVGTCLKTGNKIYYEYASAAEEDGFQHAKISAVINGERKHHWGYVWERYDAN